MIEATRSEILKDADYFATELIRRFERLARMDGRHEHVWLTAAKLTRRVRIEVRKGLETEVQRLRSAA